MPTRKEPEESHNCLDVGVDSVHRAGFAGTKHLDPDAGLASPNETVAKPPPLRIDYLRCARDLPRLDRSDDTPRSSIARSRSSPILLRGWPDPAQKAADIELEES